MNYSLSDKLCLGIDQALRTVFGKPKTTDRPYPAEKMESTELSGTDRKHIAGLMRINHAGEVCAQALYQGQSLTARDASTREQMQHAATEENDHLQWCENRLKELGSHTSYLNPLWYLGSLTIGCLAGIAGDRWSLGFLAETEAQVTKHLQSHLDKLPNTDKRSEAILQQMKIDEAQHQQHAIDAGAADLPVFIKKGMGFSSKLMTKTTYYA